MHDCTTARRPPQTLLMKSKRGLRSVRQHRQALTAKGRLGNMIAEETRKRLVSERSRTDEQDNRESCLFVWTQWTGKSQGQERVDEHGTSCVTRRRSLLLPPTLILSLSSWFLFLTTCSTLSSCSSSSPSLASPVVCLSLSLFESRADPCTHS